MAVIFGQGSSLRPVNDSLVGTPEDDQIYGRGGADTINATQGGNDIVITEDGNDTITTGTGNDQVQAGGGNNVIDDLGGNNFIKTGKLGRDAGTTDDIDTGNGNDEIVAGDSTNLINAGGGANKVYGGNGYDEITVGVGSDLVNLGGHGATDVRLITSPGNLFGSFNAGNYLVDLGGADQINSGTPDPSDGGQDLILDDFGFFVTGGPGLAARGDDTINTGDGVDVIWAAFGNDTILSGAGDDRIETSLVTITSAGQPAPGVNDDNVVAGNGNDFVRPRTGNDSIEGAGGEDFIIAGRGADRIVGGADDDIIYVGDQSGIFFNDGNPDIVDYNAITDFLGVDAATGETTNQADFVYGFRSNDKFDLGDLFPDFSGTTSNEQVSQAMSGGYLNVLGATVGVQASQLVAVDTDGNTDGNTNEWLFVAFAVGNSSSLGTGLTFDNFIV